MLRTILANHTTTLKHTPGPWYPQWNTQRTWHFTTNTNHTSIRHLSGTDKVCIYMLHRKSTNALQTFYLHSTTSDINTINGTQADHTEPINPSTDSYIKSTLPSNIQQIPARIHSQRQLTSLTDFPAPQNG
jgi:hypothetical protein